MLAGGARRFLAKGGGDEYGSRVSSGERWEGHGDTSSETDQAEPDAARRPLDCWYCSLGGDRRDRWFGLCGRR
jgi:hypothetical protein